MDGDAVYAHVALHRFNILPLQFLDMDRKEKAFVIASIKIQLDKEKKEADKMRQ